MKIAIAFFGLPRCSEMSFPSIESQILNFLPSGVEHKCFYHFYEQKEVISARSNEKGVLAESNYNCFKKYTGLLEKPEEILVTLPFEKLKTYGDAWKNDFGSLKNLLLQLHSLKKVTELVEDYEPDCEVVLKIENYSKMMGEVEIIPFITSMLCAVACGFLLSFFISKFSRFVGNKSKYIVVLPTLIPTMVLIISVIKLSLALSLGLVGALSIIRFRTPIKDPEELSYIFLAIAVGLGLGAGQLLVSIFSLLTILMILLIISLFNKGQSIEGVFIDIHTYKTDDHETVLSSLNNVFKNEKVTFDVRRYDSRLDNLGITYYIEPQNVDRVAQIIEKLKKASDRLEITLINKSRDLA